MNQDYKKSQFQERMEEYFGSNFTISVKEMGQFINALVKEGMEEEIIIQSIVSMYRDDGIDFNSLKDLFQYMDYYIPPEFAFYADKAKIILRETAEKVKTETELYELLYFYYQNDRIDYNIFKTILSLMSRQFSDEFESMTEIERKTRTWIRDKDGNNVLLSKENSNLLKCCENLKEFDVDDLFVPSSKYEYPFQFVLDYMDQNNISDKVLVNAGLDRRKKSKLRTKSIIERIDVYRFIFILDMPVTVAKQFMTLCGYTFSPLSKTDLFFLDYLNGKYTKVKTLKELTELSRKYCYEKFEFPEWL